MKINFFRVSLKLKKENKNEQKVVSKKQMIVKELAVNILELNGYRTRTEQLDNELKSYKKYNNELSVPHQQYNAVDEKTKVRAQVKENK